MDWFQQLFVGIAKSAAYSPSPFQYLGGFSSRAPVVSVKKELEWASYFLKIQSGHISEFFEKLTLVERAVYQGDMEQAVEILDDLDRRHGHSFWSAQLKIALVQMAGGLERQKELVGFYRSQHRRGVLAYLAYFTGVRNEDKTTWSHFKDTMELRLSEASYAEELKTYLRFKLLKEFPADDLGMADVLRYELSNHPFDVYTTFVTFAQEVAVNPSFAHLKADTLRALHKLSGIGDYRLSKLICLLSGKPTKIEGSTGLSTFLFSSVSGNLGEAWRASSRYLEVCPWQSLYRSAASAEMPPTSAKQVARVRNMESLLTSIVRRDGNSATALEQWMKQLRNLSGLPFVDGLGGLESSFGISGRGPVNRLSLMSLNSRRAKAEDLLLYPCIADPDLEADPTFAFFSKLVEAKMDAPTALSKLRPSAAMLAEVIGGYFREQFDKVLEAHRSPTANSISIARILSAPFVLSSLRATNLKSEMIDFIADEVSANRRAYLFSPVRESVDSLSKADWKKLRGDVAPLIALHAAWRLSDDDRIAATLRHELSAFLRTQEVEKPSELLISDDFKGTPQNVYFLRHVCRPGFMDLIRAFGSSREVLAERRTIAGRLSELDVHRAEEYATEVILISKQLRIDSGLELVDASRIHVDEDAFRRWARRNLREDYERYRELVTAGLATSSDLEETLREILSELSTRQAFYTPDDQGDAMLTNMYRQLGQQFLANSDFGLDYYLSKRIRHQSFIGLIRGPLEFANLITTRESEFGSYRPNLYWQERLKLGGSKNEELQLIFAQFANAFDALLVSLKDDILQLWSEDKPKGVFQIPIPPRALFVARSLAQAGVDFDLFLNSTYQLFWQSMEPCLSKAKSEIEDTLKEQLVELFGQFREDLRVVAESSLHYSELSTQINDTSVEVQRMLDRAASWFVKPDAQPSAARFSLKESVEIAIQSALSMHKAFDPDLNVLALGETELQPPDIMLLWETIFVGLDNVKAHSGIKQTPKIELSCELQDDGRIKVGIVSEVAKRVTANKDSQKKLREIREQIQSDKIGQKSRKEGGSGFIKLAAVLRHTPGGRIEFGFKKLDRFELSVWFRPTKNTVAVVRMDNENTGR